MTATDRAWCEILDMITGTASGPTYEDEEDYLGFGDDEQWDCPDDNEPEEPDNWGYGSMRAGMRGFTGGKP